MELKSRSRTENSARNASVAMIFYIISLGLQFVSRRVFIQFLGADILGLNSTATSLLQFLNMAELGIGAAVAFSLYKPIAENDQKTVGEIVAVQGWFYRRVALIVTISSLVLCLFFPGIFEKSHLPLWYAYATFGVLLFSALLSYIFNYKQILLSAHQLEYKITISYKLPKIIKDIAQIVCIWQFPEYGYILWVVLEGVGAIVCTASLTRTVKHHFPDIARLRLDGGRLRKSYPIILTKIKQLMFHKVGGFILFQASPLLIYAFVDLKTVAVYGNYMLIVTGISTLAGTVFNGMGASVGNLVNSKGKAMVLKVYREIFVLRFILVAVACFGYWVCIGPVTCLWVGKDFLLPNSTVSLILIVMFINMLRPAVDLFSQANGLYGDIWAPVAEGTINLGLSLILGHFFSLNGVLVGIIVSLIAIPFFWKPYYLFSRGMKHPSSFHFRLVAKLILAVFPVGMILAGITMSLQHRCYGQLYAQTGIGVTATLLFTIALLSILSFTNRQELQSLIQRLLILYHKH